MTRLRRLALSAALASPAFLGSGAARAQDGPPVGTEVFFREPDRATSQRIAGLLVQATSDNVATRRTARDGLRALGYWAVDPLLAAVRDGASQTQCAAILVLDAIGDRRALPVLREAVVREARPDYVASFATLVLGRAHDGLAVDALRRAVTSDDAPDMVRRAVPLALSKIRTPDALLALQDLVAQRDPGEPIACAQFLALGFYPEAALTGPADAPAPPLETALRSARRAEREAALLAYVVATCRTTRGKPVVAQFADPDQPPSVQYVALVGLAAFPDADVTERIAQTVRGGGPDVLREQACDLLVERADAAALPTLLQVVRSPSQTNRLKASAVLALGRIDADAARDAVLDRLKTDRAALVRAAAAVAAARSTSADLRREALARIDARLSAGETDAWVRKVLTLARAVLSGERTEVRWPAASGDARAEPIFDVVLRTPRERLLHAVNRRAELCLDLGKIGNVLTDLELNVDAGQGDVSAALDSGHSRLDLATTGAAPDPGAPPPTATAPGGAGGAGIGTRIAAWQELRDLKIELLRRPYYTADDLPAPPAAPTAPAGK